MIVGLLIVGYGYKEFLKKKSVLNRIIENG